MITNDNENDISFIQGAPIEKDWEWWSNFLQREYYGAQSELESWKITASAVASELELEPGMRLLDLGSGCGEMVMQFALRGIDALGVEQSASLVQHCLGIARQRGVMAGFTAANMFDFEPDGKFDAIISINTSFGYGSDEENRNLIKKIGGWLKPGGRFYCDLISADCAESFGCWNDIVAGGRFIVDNSYDSEQRIMTSYPTWVSPDESEIYTAVTPEVIQLYTRAEMEEMMRDAGLTPRRLNRAMGRKFTQDDEQMLTTWIAEKGFTIDD